MSRILVVDDDKDCCFFLKELLTMDGHQVETADNGTQAIEIAGRFSPEVLLCDWLLQAGIDGLDVAKRLRATLPDIQIYFMTGMPSEVIAREASEVPHMEVISKPVSYEDIAAHLSRRINEKP